MKHKILAIIPARSGSKRLPNKNTKELLGKTLIQWTIDQAKRSKLIDNIVVNSDSIEILKIAKKNKVYYYYRPQKLAQDDSSIYDVIFDQLDILPNYDVVVLLEPTSPLRKEDDIDKAIQLFLDNWDKADSLVSVGEIQLEKPELAMVVCGGEICKITNGCQLSDKENEKYYFPYGVIYISKVEALKKYKSFYQDCTIPYFIDRWQNYEVNDLCDFLAIEAIAKWYKL